MSRNEQEIVIIVGGTSGIGLESARILAQERRRVLVTGRDQLRAKHVREQSPEIETHLVDAASRGALDLFFKSVGEFDHLVLSVSGAKGAGDFTDLLEGDLREGFEQKFFAQFRAAQSALPYLNEHGSITFISAISARAANPGTSGLAAINAAIEAMIRPLARELRPRRINAISPGVVETSWWDRLPPEVRDPLLARSAAASLVNRNGTPRELAQAVSFVINNGFVTGTVLELDGGLRLT